jgi:hypothetical protein
MSANTEILIKRSLANSAPTSLMQGELAYSYVSNTLFIGTSDGTAALPIGGFNDFSANYQYGANTYGDQTHIPIITVAANGLITNVSTSEISTSLAINADVGGPSAVNLLNQTLDIAGGAGLTSTVSDQTITLDVDDTVVRSNTAMQMQLIDGDIQISGNLTVLGNTTQIEVQTLNIADPLIYLASNNYTSDIVDIGFVGNYFDGANNRHAGVFRHAGDKEFYVFDNFEPEPTANTIDPTDPSFRVATLHANIKGDVIANTVTSGGFLAAQGTPNYGLTGYSFQNDGGYDTGMFSTGDGDVILYANNEEVVHFNTGYLTISKNLYLSGLNTGDTTKVLFFNDSTGEITQGNINDVISANSISNGSYIWQVDGMTGALYSDQGVYIADQSSSVVIGQNVDVTNSNNDRVAIGNGAGQNNQQFASVAIGRNAGQSNQNFLSVAVGTNAGQYNQDHSSVAVGHGAGYSNQNSNATAIGNLAGRQGQSNYAVAIGDRAGYGQYDSQGYGGVAIGAEAAFYNQGQYAVAIGYQAGEENSGPGSIAIGDRAGQTGLTTDAIAIGTYAQENGSGWAPIAIGRYAGQSNQGSQSVAIGSHAGNNGLGYHAVALGHYAAAGGSDNQTVAIGDYAGAGYQHLGAVALGYYAGYGASQYSVAIGYGAGLYDSTPLGEYQVAIGAYAAAGNGHDNSIVLNATGNYFDAVASGLFIKPVRYTETQDAVEDGLMFYNQTTGEVRYSYILDGGSF